MPRRLTIFLICLAGLVSLADAQPDPAPARNIILMVSDGMGFNARDACSYYEHGELGQQVYDAFPVQLACTTYMLNNDGNEQGYDPNAAWSDFNYVRGEDDYTAFTDSAAAATALNTGVKTTKGRIGTSVSGAYLYTLAQLVTRVDKATGAVTSVQISHATPAGVWAQNDSRQNYEQIAREMVLRSGLDVIMGAGHPLFDNNGEQIEPGTNTYEFVGGEDTWEALVAGTTGRGWTLIQTREEFERLAGDPAAAPDRLVGVAEVYSRLQYRRDGDGMGGLNTNVPTLATMARGALNVLSRNENGFYLMIEGGAIDWANHGNNIERMIQEQMDFNAGVEAVVEWVSANSSWDETLLIVTADHECGMLWGPGSYADSDGDGYYDPGRDAFNDWMPIVNNGAGNIPGVQYASDGHTNALVPLLAIGAGSDRLLELVKGTDSGAADFWGISGRYVTNVEVFVAMSAAVGAPCLGDLDANGSIGLGDLSALLSGYGTPVGATYDRRDLNGDEDVDLDDLAQLLSPYGTTCE